MPANQQYTTSRKSVAEFTDIVLTGTAEQVAILSYLAETAGALIYRSPTRPMGGNDPRIRVYLRLHLRI